MRKHNYNGQREGERGIFSYAALLWSPCQQSLSIRGNISDYKSGPENLYTKDDIIKILDGKTTQSTKIAYGLKMGEIKLNVLGDELFESYLGVDKSKVSSRNVFSYSGKETGTQRFKLDGRVIE